MIHWLEWMQLLIRIVNKNHAQRIGILNFVIETKTSSLCYQYEWFSMLFGCRVYTITKNTSRSAKRGNWNPNCGYINIPKEMR